MPEARVQILRCGRCGTLDAGPRLLCPKCHAAAMEPREVDGAGKLLSWTIIRRAPACVSPAGSSPSRAASRRARASAAWPARPTWPSSPPRADMGDDILVEKRGAVRLITLNRPSKMNSLDFAANEALVAAFRGFEEDDDARVAVVTGAGEAAFCA